MRFSIIGNAGGKTSHDGVLYCVQRIEEMLMRYTSHIYKVPVYNSFLLAYEFLNVYNQVEKGLIEQVHLTNILEEFTESFEKDIVVKEHFSERQIKYFIGRLKGNSIHEQRRTMHYLIHVMSEYPRWSKDTLKATVKNPREKKKIEQALRCYITMLINMGYNNQYIYNECKKTFANKAVSIDNFESFLDKFTGIDNDYEVYFVVDKKIEIFKSILEERLNLSFETGELDIPLKYDKSKQVCVCIVETALDSYGAAGRAYGDFDLFMRYYRFLGNREKMKVVKNCYVVSSLRGKSIVPIMQDRHFYSKDYDDKTLGQNSEWVITHLLKNAAQNDLYRIDNIIRTHNTAISSLDINKAFLNLWSVMEIIGVDEGESGSSKIRQILKNVIPILKRNYINVIVHEMHDYLKGNLEEHDYRALIGLIDEDGTEEYKIACLLSLKKYEEARKKACIYLANYPLIRSRMCQLYDDVFKDKKTLITELQRYEKRIVWHIQRLYRVRNAIIHSGEAAENIVPLVEHLHSYVDEIIMDLIYRMIGTQGLSTVTNVLIDAQVYMETIINDTDEKNELTIDDIDIIYSIRS
ncbi:hypothetical protein SAMN04487831_11252 [Pseudobutyrivibrio sp. UC1225]|uniref:hypothetical protein n=1 Tax=Pseudobutyrivibrio sp. UC1225 TaxID=1798185 RepID=UPI0008E82CA0|nr:hypothetical protein [Pseudobutyrivibrio sp. UC1225]SFO21651.1 hypothetical protein SAMN04487831_11252 [Pseudobutyrivibrio sp. UC1225]